MSKSVNPASLIAKPPVYDQSRYAAFGKNGQTAFSQGWFPQTGWFNNGTVYASPYNNAFHDVMIPNSKDKGDVALIGYPNNTFDIVIRKKDGNIAHTINKGVSSDFVQNYITNNNSVVAERNNSILKGVNQDGRLVSSLLASK